MANPSVFSGSYNAVEFAFGTPYSGAPALQVISGSTATGAYTLTCSPTSLRTAAGVNIPISVNTPITVGSSAGIETVTPTAVTINQLNQILITATFTYAHATGAQVRSGSFGLMEAFQQAATDVNPGGLIILSPAWMKANGITTNAALTTKLANYNSLSASVTVLNWGGISGALSYKNSTVGSALAATATALY